MTTDPQDAVPSADDDEVPEPGPAEVPLEANEADFVEQRTDVPDWGDEEDGDT